MESTTVEQPAQNDTAVPFPQAPLPAQRPERTLKVVLTLQPRDDVHYRALIALGADGCDPVLHTLDGQGLPGILAAIPDLLVRAEAHWAVHPRYPTVPTPPKATAKSATAAKPSSTQAEQAAVHGNDAHPPHPTPTSVLDADPPGETDSAGQLTLFG